MDAATRRLARALLLPLGIALAFLLPALNATQAEASTPRQASASHATASHQTVSKGTASKATASTPSKRVRATPAAAMAATSTLHRASTDQAAPGTTITPRTSRQVIVATATSSKTGTIVWYEWNGKAWIQRGSAPATFGYRGLRDASQRREGDATTPIGTFGFVTQLGTSSIDPAMPYRRITPCSYIVSDPGNPQYNRWVESCGKPPSGGVRLMSYVTNSKSQFRHAAWISFNYDHPVRGGAGSGSGVLLHYEPQGYNTTGCVGVTDRAQLERLLSWMDASKNPQIVVRTA